MDVAEVEIHQADVPKPSSGSSSSGESARRSCAKCHGRMSSFSLDRHLFCTKCRGSECTISSRCDECFSWTKEEMEGYVKLRKSLTSKSKKSKPSFRSSSSPPRSTAPDSDLDSRFAAQFDSMNKAMDKKLDDMSTALKSRFSRMLTQCQSGTNQPSLSGDSVVQGYCGCQAEPPSLQTPVCTKSRTGLRFREGEEDSVPHEAGLAPESIPTARVALGSTSESSRDPPPVDSEKSKGQDSQTDLKFTYGDQFGADYAFQHEDEEDDDKESIADPPIMDGTYARLVSFIHDRFPHSHPSTAAHVPPRCELEDFFSINDPAPSTRQNLTVYPRVAELVTASADRTSRLAREPRALHRVVPIKRRMFYVGDDPDYCYARFLNPDFARISKSKNILKTCASSVTLADLEKLDHDSRTILAGDSNVSGSSLLFLLNLRMTGIGLPIRPCLIKIFLRCRLLWLRRRLWRPVF